MDTYLAVVQTVTVVVAVVGIGAALKIAQQDRREAARIAEEDRHESARIAEEDRQAYRHEAERRHTLDLLTRLTMNLERGGSSDSQEVKRMGAEARALQLALGPDRFPAFAARNLDWRTRAIAYNAEASQEPDWRVYANEALLELDRVARDPDAR
jgi:hypothetical protein